MSVPLPALSTRRGHFVLESGLHAGQWLDLDILFVDPTLLAPHIDTLAASLTPHDVSAVCGPLVGGAFVAQAVAAAMGKRFYFTERRDGPLRAAMFGVEYRLPPALRAPASNERFAIVDDVISAGSSVRATAAALGDAGASVAVIGALMILGDHAVRHFVETGTPLVSAYVRPFETWTPDACPLCRDGLPIVLP